MARPVYPSSEQIWTTAKAYKSTYFDDQNAILKESIQRARQTLLDKYQANATYVGYQRDLIKIYQDNLARMQDGLNDYNKSKAPGASTGSGPAALLKVIVDAAGNEQEATGKASQRRLDAQAQTEASYLLTPAQSNTLSEASSFKGTDLRSITSEADAKLAIDKALSSIPVATFAPGANSSKSATSQLFTTLNSKLTAGSTIYTANPTLKNYLEAAVIDKMGVNTAFLSASKVEADKKLNMKAAGDTAASVGGIGLGRDAAARALAALNEGDGSGKGAPLPDDTLKFLSSIEILKYKKYVDEGATLEDARQRVADQVGRDAVAGQGGFKEMQFLEDFEALQESLAAGDDWDTYKYFDNEYVGKLAAVKNTQRSLEGAERRFASGVKGLEDVPTEQQARRLGAQINAPLEPGYVGKYGKEAGLGLLAAQASGNMRRGRADDVGNPLSTPDDYLASRILSPVRPGAVPGPKMSDAERIAGGATLRAVRGYNDFDFENTYGKERGLSLYNRVKNKTLEGGATKDNIVKAAAVLGGGDQKLRDRILSDFYSYTLRDMKAIKPVVDEPPPPPQDPQDPDDDGNVKMPEPSDK